VAGTSAACPTEARRGAADPSCVRPRVCPGLQQPGKQFVIAYASGSLGDVGDVVALAPQACNDLPLHTLVGEYLQAPAVGSLAEDPEYLVGKREGHNRLRPGVLLRATPL
jgi:hypothetical protein